MVTSVKAGGIHGWNTHHPNDKCLLNTDCGPKGGLFTDFCSVVCRAGGFKGSKCTNFKGQGYAVCTCEGKGDSEVLLKANCTFLCDLACKSCGYEESYCSSEKKTVKSVIQCNCNKKIC